MHQEILWTLGLVALFQIKHYVGDFPLQTSYMLRKVEAGWSFVLPLATHCAVHSILSLPIILYVAPEMWWLALMEFVIHFVMDRIKAGPKYLGRFRDKGTVAYWSSYGFDQLVHHLTNIYMVWVLLTGQLGL